MDTKLPCSVRFLGSALQLLLQQQEPRVVWFKDIFGSSQLTPGHFDFSYPSLPSAQTGKLSFSCCTSLVKIPIDCKGMFIGMDGPITEGLSQQELLREYGWDSVQCDWEIHHRSGLGEQSPADGSVPPESNSQQLLSILRGWESEGEVFLPGNPFLRGQRSHPQKGFPPSLLFVGRGFNPRNEIKAPQFESPLGV